MSYKLMKTMAVTLPIHYNRDYSYRSIWWIDNAFSSTNSMKFDHFTNHFDGKMKFRGLNKNYQTFLQREDLGSNIKHRSNLHYTI